MGTVAGLFEQRSSADRALEELEQAGFGRDAISVVIRGDTQEREIGGSAGMAEAARSGAGGFELGGVAVGGVVGLLAGLGALAIPGIGPILAVGTIGSAFVGAAGGAAVGGLAGGVLEVLSEHGFSDEHAHVYAEGVRRGGVLIAVEAADEARADEAQAILSRSGAVSPEEQRAIWLEHGWGGFDAGAAPFDPDAHHPGWHQSDRPRLD
jgi:hypothetical protein